jgi:hypothetical protein
MTLVEELLRIEWLRINRVRPFALPDLIALYYADLLVVFRPREVNFCQNFP